MLSEEEDLGRLLGEEERRGLAASSRGGGVSCKGRVGGGCRAALVRAGGGCRESRE